MDMPGDSDQRAGCRARDALAEEQPGRSHQPRLALDEICRLGGLGQQFLVLPDGPGIDEDAWPGVSRRESDYPGIQ